jgi:hypothetical protein
MMIIAVDFDGVICSYKDGWQGVDKFGALVPGAVDVLNRLRNEGHKIIIHTARVPTKKLVEFLIKNNVPYDAINQNPMDNFGHYYKKLDINPEGVPRKVVADIYIDDRGITFDGDWYKIYENIQTFKPWEKR